VERTQAFLDSHGITQTELGRALGMTAASVSRKLAGFRNWKLAEVQRVLEFLIARLGRPVTYEEVFGIEHAEDVRRRDAPPARPHPAPGSRRRRVSAG
jgi:transcriptional regulator with XRE-family HTH domain